ncbi:MULTISPECIES: GlcG/HbpS family heme-binding protein [unclassified Aeromicrobium]|uniref:GlcG/HbpS family heme-binding protein n=1 Tax=unclassified Aeromicrobium TaxID=2633570 RepID=UPI00396B369B
MTRLELHLAQAAVAGALAHAAQREAPSAVAVVDLGGNLLAFAADPDAILAARDLAVAKAYTSLSLRAESGALDSSVQPGGPFYGLNTALSGRPLVTFAGGRPLMDETGNVIGAVGVSGGTLDDDTQISAAAVSAFEDARSQQAARERLDD